MIHSTSLYFEEGDSVTTGNALATITSTASCETGDIVLEGGYNINNFGGGPLFILNSNPSVSGDSYSTTVRAAGVSIQSNVLCFDNSPASTLAAASTVSTFQQPENSPIMSQGIVDSPKLTALEKQPDDLTANEKITKLKQQWINQLS
jgi:hypothetical protein